MQQKKTRWLSGTIAGWAMVTAGQPLDYIKTMYQVRHHQMPSIKQLYKNVGLKGFYKGASSIYLFVGVITALQFQIFQRTMEMFNRFCLQTKQSPKTYLLMLAGSITGIASSFIYTPTQYAKILCQIQHKPSKGSASMIIQVLYKQGIKGIKKLYTGHTMTLGKQSIGSGLYYGGYYITLQKIFKQQREQALLIFQVLAGSVAGVLYQLYSYPLDMIKTNVQSGKKTINQMICSQFWKMKSFKAGFILALGRSIMVDAINFSVYENCRNFFCYQNGGNKVM